MLGWKYCTGFLISVLVVCLSVHAQGQPQIKKQQVDKAIQELEKLAQQAIQNKVVPGLAIAVVFQDKVVYAQGFGVREVGKSEPVNPDTVFQLASVSKPIGATVVAALVGDKKISWDSKISDLDPTFAMYDPWVTREITIRDLYAHRSGLPEHAGDLLEDLGYDRAHVLYRLRFQKPDSSFRTHYAYTNFGLTEAALHINTRKAADVGPQVTALRQLSSEARLVSFEPLHHKFAYWYQEPVPIPPWPTTPEDLPDDVVYFAMDVSRSGKHQQRELPFTWEPIARLNMDKLKTEDPFDMVVVGQRIKDEVSDTKSLGAWACPSPAPTPPSSRHCGKRQR
jgi:hypothetical protein